MPLPAFDQQALINVAIAALGGVAIGVERQWSGKAAGPRARFAGVRTFTLLGLVSGLIGWLWTVGAEGPAVVFLAGLGALVVVAYFSASRTDIDGTTEVAAFVVMVAGVLAGAGLRPLASAVAAVTVLLLVEKKRLHGWVQGLDREEVRAGARFAVMAAVVLPLLPAGPFGPYGAIRPRTLWALVLFFSGLSFVGYVARKIVGPSRGYLITGTLGGLVSSTSVTLTFSRLSQNHPDAGRALAAGAIAASVMLLPRLVIATAVLAPALSRALWPLFIIPAGIGIALALTGWHVQGGSGRRQDAATNPLQFTAALQMAALFQIVLFAVGFMTAHFGQAGIYSSAAVLGLADMDALTISMAQLTTAGTAAATTAAAVTIGIISNTILKLAVALTVGRGPYRWIMAAGLALMAVALGAGLYWLSPEAVRPEP
jgi:uncharacterized membrane protein (DUF4010 family)